jgi:cytochrome c peroxidase
MRSVLFALAWGWSVLGLSAPHEHPEPVILAPGYSPLEFAPPEPGSYRLPPMGLAADGDILLSSGKAAALHSLLGDKPVLLSFIFTRCDDVNGCPLATYVMRGVAKKLQRDMETNNSVRLVSFSFDPEFDTPSILSAYGDQFRDPGTDWAFVTAASNTALDQILEGYGQWVIRDVDAEGQFLGNMSHVLRVFLIDKNKHIRNIYSTSFLHADTVSSDVRTLLAEP